MAALLMDVLRTQVLAGRFTIHDFVVMPNHVHILLTIPGDLTIERALQVIKGGFSFRAKRELRFAREIWQKGFSDVGVRDRANFLEHRRYIEQNPVKDGLAATPNEYPYGSAVRFSVDRGRRCHTWALAPEVFYSTYNACDPSHGD
jgi:putative transposase